MIAGAEPFIALVDAISPSLHWLAVGIVVVGIPMLLWLTKMRFDWRKDRRETFESIAALMGRLVDQQRAELSRLVSEGDALRRQIDLFIAGRGELQRALDDMREQMIAARLMIHDYERRLGLPETTFPPMPSMAVIPRLS